MDRGGHFYASHRVFYNGEEFHRKKGNTYVITASVNFNLVIYNFFDSMKNNRIDLKILILALYIVAE